MNTFWRSCCTVEMTIYKTICCKPLDLGIWMSVLLPKCKAF